MITELVLRAIVLCVDGLDALIPSVPWPSWLDLPVDYFSSHVAAGSVSLNGLFAYIHPTTIDLMVLMIGLRSTERVVRRVRALMSTATGGGGVAL